MAADAALDTCPPPPSHRDVCTRPATMRRPSLTSVLHWGPMPMPAPPVASCSGAGGTVWTTAVSADCGGRGERVRRGRVEGLGVVCAWTTRLPLSA